MRESFYSRNKMIFSTLTRIIFTREEREFHRDYLNELDGKKIKVLRKVVKYVINVPIKRVFSIHI